MYQFHLINFIKPKKQNNQIICGKVPNRKTSYIMKGLIPVLFICILICLTQCKGELNKYLDPWNSIDTIQGKFETNHTLFKYAKCNPCDYLIVIYRDFVELLIDHPQEGKADENVLAFEFTIEEKHFDESFWEVDRHNFKLAQKRNISESLESATNQGVQWSYELTLPIEGLILKGRTGLKYEIIIPVITLIFSILILLAFPLTTTSRREQAIQIPRRTPLVSLIILGNLQHTILIEIVVFAMKYLIHEDSFMMKGVWYILFTIPFGIIILQILYIYDGLKVRFLTTFKRIQSGRIREVSLVILFLVGIYLITGILLFVRKGIWIYAYFAIYILWQIGESIFIKTYPYLRLTLYFILLLAYQMFLSNCGPLFWFEQLTLKEVTICAGVILTLILLGSILQKFLIGIEIVNQVVFEESKSLEMVHQNSSKSTTQVNLEQ